MARGGLKPPKPRSTKEATLAEIHDLLKPEVYDRLGPVGTMNMLQTLATVAKVPEITNVPALVDEPVLPALAGEPSAQKKVQRRVSEAKTGLESPQRRQVLKAARDVAGATMMPIPTSVQDVLISEVAKPALKSIPDSAIQAAIAAFLKPKLKPVQLERVGREGWERVTETGEEPALNAITATEIANFAKLPVEDVEDYLKRTEADIGQSLDELSRDFYQYKGFRDEVFDSMDMADMFRFADMRGYEGSPFEQAVENFIKKHPEKGTSYTKDDFESMLSEVNNIVFEETHGPTLKNLSSLIGQEEADKLRKALRTRFNNTIKSEDFEDPSDMLFDYLDLRGYGMSGPTSKPKISHVKAADLLTDSDEGLQLERDRQYYEWLYKSHPEVREDLVQWVGENRPELSDIFKKYTE